MQVAQFLRADTAFVAYRIWACFPVADYDADLSIDDYAMRARERQQYARVIGLLEQQHPDVLYSIVAAHPALRLRSRNISTVQRLAALPLVAHVPACQQVVADNDGTFEMPCGVADMRGWQSREKHLRHVLDALASAPALRRLSLLQEHYGDPREWQASERGEDVSAGISRLTQLSVIQMPNATPHELQALLSSLLALPALQTVEIPAMWTTSGDEGSIADVGAALVKLSSLQALSLRE
jgi:hypothetical protein